jgi:hypothetical protein
MNFVFPRQIPDREYFVGIVAAAFVVCIGAILKKNLALPKISSLGVAVFIWSVIDAISKVILGNASGDRLEALLPISLGIFFFILETVILHEEEWLRILRLAVWIGVLFSWPAIFGSMGRIFLQSYASIFLPLFFLALVFTFRKRGTIVSRVGFGSAALFFGWLLFLLYKESGILNFNPYFWPAIRILRFDFLERFGFPSAGILVLGLAATLFLWGSLGFSIIKIARRRTATPLWIAGLSAAFLGQLVVDPFFGAWFGSTMIFILLLALVEWLNHHG